MGKSIIFAAFVSAAALTAPVFAVNTTWVGNSSADWADNMNWTPNAVPAASTTNDDVFFNSPGLHQPVVSSAQPTGTGFIPRLVFDGNGVHITGAGPLTLDRGNVELNNTRQYINANAGTNTVSVPLMLGSGGSGTAYFLFANNAAVVLDAPLKFTGAVRNLFLNGLGTLDFRSTFIGADFYAGTGCTLLLNNPAGVAYAPTAGHKVRANGGTVKWLQDNQINATTAPNNILMRVDNNGLADLNGKTDTIYNVYFSLDSTVGGMLDTGETGLLNIRYIAYAIHVGSASRIPSTTSTINGNVHFMGTQSETARISTRRGTADAELIINAVLSGDCSVSVDNIADSGGASGGIVVFNGANTYAQTTKVINGTLVVNGTTGPGKVEVNALGRLEGTGLIDPIAPASTISVTGTLAPGAPLGTLTIGSPNGGENDVVFNAGSILEIRADESGAASLVVNGKILTANNAKLRLVATGRVPVGVYTVVDASGGIPGDFAAKEGETDLMRFRRDPGSNIIKLQVSAPGMLLMLK